MHPKEETVAATEMVRPAMDDSPKLVPVADNKPADSTCKSAVKLKKQKRSEVGDKQDEDGVKKARIENSLDKAEAQPPKASQQVVEPAKIEEPPKTFQVLRTKTTNQRPDALTLVSFKGRILISLKGEGWAVDGDGIALNERPVAVRLNDGDVLNIAE